MIITIFLVLVACVVCFFLSASETAITTASHIRTKQLMKKGNARAKVLLSLQERMNTMITTVLLANTCLFAGITALVTKIVNEHFGNWGIVIASLLLSLFITLYLEILPKIYACHDPEKVALALSPSVKILSTVLRPITYLMDLVSHKTLIFFGVSAKPKQMSLEDLRGAIDLHTGERSFHERIMLRNVLDLSRVTVAEVMVHRKDILSFSIDTPESDLITAISEAPYTRIPLWKNSPDNVIGIVNMKSLAKTLLEKKEIVIKDIMKDPFFIPETSTLFSQLQLFKKEKMRQAFVVDEYGSLMGMVTLEDIIEEIVGEILDEHETNHMDIHINSDGDYIVSGDVTLRDLERQCEWNFIEDEGGPLTLAGLILQEMREIPHVGASIIVKGYTMTIMQRHDHQITLIKVKPPAPQETP